MPRIFDNIDLHLLDTLRGALSESERADFCVGYFNLRGWKDLVDHVEQWEGGGGHCCRVMVGMQRLDRELVRDAMSLVPNGTEISNQEAVRKKKEIAREFRHQLTFGAPTDADEMTLRQLARQLRQGKVRVKLFLRHPLHAKLYLLFRNAADPFSPSIGFLGSSNLTFSGLTGQGELNVDVLDHDACAKLAQWFEDRWTDRYSFDISDELAEIIEESWAREEPVPPYHIYIKMAYHLSHEARAGLTEFPLPDEIDEKLFDFQSAAVRIAAHHLHRRNGVLLGDVVGLGKSHMASALAHICEADMGLETLIICPKNLTEMWEEYRHEYSLRGRVVSITQYRHFQDLPRYRLVILDESHNLRNRDAARYRALKDYLEKNDSRVILLSATPYNKDYLDLANQLRLFVPEHLDLGIRPEQHLKRIGEAEFLARNQCPVRSLAAFEKSDDPDDWRELMRLFLVRRTRTFVKQNYAAIDKDTGRPYLELAGERQYFPERVPRKLTFPIEDNGRGDQYAYLLSDEVVDTVGHLALPRYGYGNYVVPRPDSPPTQDEARTLEDLSRAGHRLRGFCRTNLFKRAESSGYAFLQSVERHILRNFVVLHALETGQRVPIGSQDPSLLDTNYSDEDTEAPGTLLGPFGDDPGEDETSLIEDIQARAEEEFRRHAAAAYDDYWRLHRGRFRWLPSELFVEELARDLERDARRLLDVLTTGGAWDPAADAKLDRLTELLTEDHAGEKVLIFSQFADTVRYVERELRRRGLANVQAVTGQSENPTRYAHRFSPVANGKRDRVDPDDELRVLVATDVLSEGQNLQDAHIVVNYDMPWAIIRLVQRAGRVDRIGQEAEDVLCYTFLPAEGVESVLRLHSRVRSRLRENAEVIGTDEEFFEDETHERRVRDLYHEQAGILDEAGDEEVDLASRAYQIWENAIERDPGLEQAIEELPNVVYSTRSHVPYPDHPEGVLVYLKTALGHHALAWMDASGEAVTESQSEILRAAACAPDTPALPRRDDHHDLVRTAVDQVIGEQRHVGGEIGSPRSARYRTYMRLKQYADEFSGTLFGQEEIDRAADEIYRHPLQETAAQTLNRLIRASADKHEFVKRVLTLWDEDRLTSPVSEEERQEPQIISSMGLIAAVDDGEG